MKEYLEVKRSGFRHPEYNFVTEDGLVIGRVADCDAAAKEKAVEVAAALGVNVFMPKVDRDGVFYAKVELGEIAPSVFESLRFYGEGIILRATCTVRGCGDSLYTLQLIHRNENRKENEK